MRKQILHIAYLFLFIVGTSVSLMAKDNRTGEEIFLFRNDRLAVSQLYPNPASDFVQIDVKSNGNIQDLKLVIFNIIGQEVKTVTLDVNEKSQRINLKDLNPGMYPYQLVLDGRSLVTKKLIIND